ncbi:MAG: tyrosine protein phosphatase [Chloroflexota bacterium]|nr:tyrosine protein phosphatase [Chloroflexota bacterium]
MIDLHNHILPGVDDGARTIEESREMARALVARGVTAACATPHTTEWSSAGNAADIGARVADLQSDLDRQGIGLRLLPGAEAHITPQLAKQVREKQVPTLNGSQYLLLEFPYDHLPPYHEQVIFELQLDGIVPIIAHPERIDPIARDPRLLEQLVRRGCLAQLTASSLTGGFGRKVRAVSEAMLAHHLIHAIASDAHNADAAGRLAGLDDLHSTAARVVGPVRARELVEDIPAQVIAGGRVVPAPPKPYHEPRLPFLKGWRS